LLAYHELLTVRFALRCPAACLAQRLSHSA
jgi:hypothetical protein